MSARVHPRRIPSFESIVAPATLVALIFAGTVLAGWTVPSAAVGYVAIGVLGGVFHTGLAYFTVLSDQLDTIEGWLENGAIVVGLLVERISDVAPAWIIFSALTSFLFTVAVLRWQLRLRFDAAGQPQPEMPDVSSENRP